MSTVKVTVRVRDGWAVYDGTEQHSGGAVVTVPAGLAEQWQQAGWADPVADKPKKPATT